MTQKAPGRYGRAGITLLELADLFPDEGSARDWFEGIVWPTGERGCPRCGSVDTHVARHAKMPYRCRDCRKYFSVKTGAVMEGSPIPLRKWVYAIYLDVTALKGVSSMKLHRDLGVTQKTAWFMRQRIREAFAVHGDGPPMSGPVDADETYVGGLEKNKHLSKKLYAGRGSVGKTAVVGGRMSLPTTRGTEADTIAPPRRGRPADYGDATPEEVAAAVARRPRPTPREASA